ncbi:hypothetical protein [Chelatococcus reniformis]|uniref:Uncharacterized protein n=1 Tax=Chelatococcus reniformis TaxID=1494448 RepID=A0A916XEK5_9HYPH|nr:hypothetical protein [Chelatococcus reniformis]GGC64680.1 hypothetical protein GCM10010994_24070 [Chelatococcus reniformis]
MAPAQLFEDGRPRARWTDVNARFARLSARKPGWQLVILALAITTALWVGSKVDNRAWDDLWPWRGPAQLTILWSLTLMAVALVTGSRSQLIEPLFGGLDRAVRVHRIVGPAAVGLLVTHVLLLIPLWVERGGALPLLVIPFVSPQTASFDVFILVSWGFVLLAVLAYVRWRCCAVPPTSSPS